MKKQEMMLLRDAVAPVVELGDRFVHIRGRVKGPTGEGWTSGLSLEELESYIGADDNVGLLTGDGLVDVDLDDEVARSLAPIVLPSTGLVSGRPGSPASHWWFATTIEKTTRFTAPGGNTLLEIRGAGAQTVIPPSLHEGTGEELRWERSGEPGEVDTSLLEARCRLLAASTLIVHNYPEEGSRNEFSVAFAGVLLRAGVEPDFAKQLIRAVAEAADDEEASERAQAVTATGARIENQLPATGAPRLIEFVGPDAGERVLRWLGDVHGDGNAVHDGPPVEKQSQAQRLLEIVHEADVFADLSGSPYITVNIADHKETLQIVTGGRLDSHLRVEFKKRHGQIPGGDPISNVIKQTAAEARMAGRMYRIYRRVARDADVVTVDLADPSWRAVEVTSTGWRQVATASARFRRSSIMRPLTAPTSGGSLKDLEALLGMEHGDDFALIVGFLLAAYRGLSPYLILIISGEQGSAKSTTTRIIRNLIDPTIPPTRSLSKDARDLVIGAQNSHVLAFDNVSSISIEISDALCRLATDPGLLTRKLYSDADESVFLDSCPIILNGIPSFATRGDLLDRAVTITLPSIPPERRLTQSELDDAFDRLAPGIIGMLLDAVSCALARFDSITLKAAPRMADVAKWVTAAEPALGWEHGTFLRAYERNATRKTEVAVDASPVAATLVNWVRERHEDVWQGAPTALLTALTAYAGDRATKSLGWPTTVNQFGSQLTAIAPAVRAQGIDVVMERTAKARQYTITRRPA